MWLAALRRAAGLPPLYHGEPGWPKLAGGEEIGPPLASPSPEGELLLDIAAQRVGEEAKGMEAEGGLSMSQRCSWLYLTAQLDFVR